MYVHYVVCSWLFFCVGNFVVYGFQHVVVLENVADCSEADESDDPLFDHGRLIRCRSLQFCFRFLCDVLIVCIISCMCVRAWLKDSCIALLCCYLLLSHCNWQMSDHIMYLIHFAAVNRCNYVQRILTYKVVFPGIRCDDVYTALDILKTRYRLCKLTL